MPTPGKPASYAFAKVSTPAGELLDVEPICSSGATGTAAPSLRTTEFVKAFGANGTLESICEDDFKPAFGRLGALIAARLENPSPAGGAAPEPTGGAGGMGGTGGMASKTDAGALGSDGAAAGGTGGTGSGGGDGGGCRLGSRKAQPSFWAGLLVAGAVVQSLRRRRRS